MAGEWTKRLFLIWNFLILIFVCFSTIQTLN
ncbi:MAG: hypothetical protein JEZ09_00990 [Salinivirgaceae bacterium]|nr:hypothetical protein [Salinivirgaceae bacterium]